MYCKIRKSFWSIFTMLLLSAVSFSLTSCGDDNDEPPTPNNSKIVENIEAFDYLEFGQAWYEFFDIKVTLSTEKGTQSFMLTSNAKDTFVFPYDTAPNPIVFLVEATPKENGPTIENNKTYDLSATVYCKITGKDAKGNLVSGFGTIGEFDRRQPAATADELKKELKEHILVNLEYTLEPKEVKA